LVLAALAALGQGRPNLLLDGAALGAAREFAVAAAKERGWTLVATTPAGAVFEQALEGSEDGELVLESIRVHADLVPESAGVRIYLSAEQLRSPGTDAEWMTEVTDRYADNLKAALDSLRAKWDRRPAGAGSPTGAGRAAPGSPKASPQSSPQSPDPGGRIGTWAYYAERWAESQGCTLADSGAALAAAGEDSEHYLVPCADGSERRVRCLHGDCTGTP
jgi:hypothetical protein